MVLVRLGLAALGLTVAAVVGCTEAPAAPGARPPLPPTATGSEAPTPASYPAYAATARVPLVEVHDAPGGPVTHRLDHPQPSGAPLVFLLDRREGEWLRVHLPVRPNGSTGWVPAAAVSVSGLRHRLDVRRSAHRLDLYTDGVLTRSIPVGVGTRDTPTPGGTYYLKELVQPPTPDGPYGAYAYGLSGFSPVLSSFGEGEGVIGLHGTNDPESIGRDVSHGCLRVGDADLRELVALLPLGTPVRILP